MDKTVNQAINCMNQAVNLCVFVVHSSTRWLVYENRISYSYPTYNFCFFLFFFVVVVVVVVFFSLKFKFVKPSEVSFWGVAC